MKLCSRLFVLYCRNYPKDDKFRYFIPILRKLGGVEPWLMARRKARIELLLSVIGLLFLSVTAKISGEGVIPGEYFFGFYKTKHILLSDSANCTVVRAVVLTQHIPATDSMTTCLV